MNIGEPVERVIQFEQVRVGGGDRVGEGVQIDSSAAPTPFEAVLVPSAVDQNAAHRLGGGGEEMAAAAPVLRCVGIH